MQDEDPDMSIQTSSLDALNLKNDGLPAHPARKAVAVVALKDGIRRARRIERQRISTVVFLLTLIKLQ